MSAFVVSDTHVDALLTAGLAWSKTHRLTWLAPVTAEDAALLGLDLERTTQPGHPWGPDHVALSMASERSLTPDTANRVGSMLLAENCRSVFHRYPDDADEYVENLTSAGAYAFTPVPGTPDPVTVLKLLACLDYQSSEHPEWEQSEALAFVLALRSFAIAELAGYDEAPWVARPGFSFPTMAGTQ